MNATVEFLRRITSPVLLLFLTASAYAQPDPSNTTNSYYGAPIGSWSFANTNDWRSDFGAYPRSTNNLTASWLGDGTAVVVDSANPAWLQYNVTESTGTNNLKVNVGSVLLWFAPSWSGTNQGGTGPGVWGRLLEVGDESGSGLWSLYVDPAGVNLYFTVQTNGGPAVTYLSAPIEWATNFWHCVALTYTASNSVLYLDGNLATNGPGITNFPGPTVLANGFFIGGDSTGTNQAHGMFDDLTTYDYPISHQIVSVAQLTGGMYFYLNPLNRANWMPEADSTQYNTPVYNAVTGAGFLQYLGASGSCTTSGNLWMTNVSASALSQPMTFNFSIAGGTNGYAYDVFAEPALTPTLTNGMWSWMGQGATCSRYAIGNLPMSGSVFFILGSPQDSDGDGLTDAYERLVSHTDPNVADTSGDGLLDGWKVQWALNLFQNNPNQPNLRSNYGYDSADWLNGVSGARSGSITNDPEGNVLRVSQ